MSPLASIADEPNRAFPAHARIDRFFASPSASGARRRIVECLHRGDGPALLLGAAGVGKTMLVEVIAADLADRLRTVRLATAQLCTRRALLQAVLHGLGEPYRHRDEGELRLSLDDAIRNVAAEPAPVALLVDEAQTLPTRLLEELRLLCGVVVDGSPRVRLLLSGTGSLDEVFTAPELEAFNQRIACRCFLEPLSRDETSQYVRAHVAAAGGNPDRLLGDDAYDAVWRASDGLPRLINQVADRAVRLAAEASATQIDAVWINQAWSDLHQLAAPWHTPAPDAAAASAAAREAEPAAIEFGVLEDDEPLASSDQGDEKLAAAIDWSPATSDAPAVGVWNADEGLQTVASTPLPAQPDFAEQPEDDFADECDEPLVSYAFPSVQSEQEDTANDAAVVVDEPQAGTAPKTAAVDPFAESFDEEEVVLDPFASLEAVAPAAPRVTATTPTAVGEALGELVGAGTEFADPEHASEEDATELDPDEELPIAADEHDEVLVLVDEDPPGESGVAPPKEYAQLFASLRGV